MNGPVRVVRSCNQSVNCTSKSSLTPSRVNGGWGYWSWLSVKCHRGNIKFYDFINIWHGTTCMAGTWLRRLLPFNRCHIISMLNPQNVAMLFIQTFKHTQHINLLCLVRCKHAPHSACTCCKYPPTHTITLTHTHTILAYSIVPSYIQTSASIVGPVHLYHKPIQMAQ